MFQAVRSSISRLSSTASSKLITPCSSSSIVSLSTSKSSISPKIALVLGSSGALGSTVAKYLGRELGMTLIGADIVELAHEFNESDWELDAFIKVPNISQQPSIEQITTELATGVDQILEESEGIDVIVVASVRDRFRRNIYFHQYNVFFLSSHIYEKMCF